MFVSWVVMGDFNALINGDERIGGNATDPGSIVDFNQCLLDCNLLDAGFVGSKYKWTNGKVSQRLDRVVCNQSCMDQYSVLNIRHLVKTGSDHCPHLIDLMINHSTPEGSFHFQHMWLKYANLFQVVEELWNVPVYGNPFYVLMSKLRALKTCLKKWNREKFGNIFTLVESTEEKVIVCEGVYETTGSDVDKEMMCKATADHLHYLAIEDEYWKQ
ncbi:hypothetical protein LIER_36841 [Lithospermum erythrorhizon]|uniref:Uncharacterized protein n=1 Tax=Lithospermum erythrorhizon TaxID=34254 RepID=A0AAV3PFA6_LITER